MSIHMFYYSHVINRNVLPYFVVKERNKKINANVQQWSSFHPIPLLTVDISQPAMGIPCGCLVLLPDGI